MKVYSIRCDVNQFQSLYPEDSKVWGTKMLLFDGTPKAQHWKPPKMYSHKPLLKRPDF